MFAEVALRKESVDRNAGGFPTIKAMRGSLSARRAWIEIITNELLTALKTVALRKESVDRNTIMRKSISVMVVALRKESVDRNTILQVCIVTGRLSLSVRRAWIEI